MTPAQAIPVEIPICRMVAIKAPAVPDLSRDTAPIIKLVLGDINSPPPMPKSTSLIMISPLSASASRRLSRKSPAQMRAIPTVHNGLEPNLSDNQPDNGAMENMNKKYTPKMDPASEAEKPTPSMR